MLHLCFHFRIRDVAHDRKSDSMGFCSGTSSCTSIRLDVLPRFLTRLGEFSGSLSSCSVLLAGSNHLSSVSSRRYDMRAKLVQ